jgi:RNA polymerase sigma factor for flagellar operon FliA
MATSPVSTVSKPAFSHFPIALHSEPSEPDRPDPDLLAPDLPHLDSSVWKNQAGASTIPSTAYSGASACESKNGTNSSREQALLDHLPLVRYAARRIHERLPQHVELDDLVSSGFVGLIDALDKFDSTRNVQFRSYAQFRIRGAILDSLRTLDWGSRQLRRQGRSIEEAVQTLTKRLQRIPTEDEIAGELGMSLDRYQEILGDLRGLQIGSLQQTIDEDSTDSELERLPASQEEDPYQRCLRAEMSHRLKSAMEQMPEREARVLTLYYREEMTLKQIGAILGLVESRVSQIRGAAVVRLRGYLNGGRLPDPRRRHISQSGVRAWSRRCTNSGPRLATMAANMEIA